MSNNAEGFERRSAAEFRRYLMISLGSCAELRSQLYLAMDIGLVSDSSHQELHEQSQEVARLLAALRRSIRKENDGMSWDRELGTENWEPGTEHWELRTGN